MSMFGKQVWMWEGAFLITQLESFHAFMVKLESIASGTRISRQSCMRSAQSFSNVCLPLGLEVFLFSVSS